MSEEHKRMINALKEIVVPRLREQGFKGSFPHFRRARKEQIDLLVFQFDRSGGGFIIEISKCPSEGFMTYLGEFIPPNKVTVWHMHPNDRLRIQPKTGSSTSDWFRYDNSIRVEYIFEKTAKEVLKYVEFAEKWWIG